MADESILTRLARLEAAVFGAQPIDSPEHVAPSTLDQLMGNSKPVQKKRKTSRSYAWDHEVEIKKLKARGLSYDEIAKKFRVSGSTIARILGRRG